MTQKVFSLCVSEECLACTYLTLDALGDSLRIVYILSRFLSLRSCNFQELKYSVFCTLFTRCGYISIYI